MAKTTETKSSKKAIKERQAAARRKQQQQTLLFSVGAVILLVAVVIIILVQGQNVEAAVPDGVTDTYASFAEKGYMGRTEQGFFYLGAENAPVTIEEFSSFSCSACLSYARNMIKPIHDKIEAGEVKLIYMPLTQFGSFDSEGMNRGAICAGVQGKFWEFHDTMFDWQTRYGPSGNDYGRLTKAAEALGLDTSEFSSCLNASSTTDLIELSRSIRDERGVTATPTIYVDGVKIHPTDDGLSAVSLSQLRGLIESKVAAN